MHEPASYDLAGVLFSSGDGQTGTVEPPLNPVYARSPNAYTNTEFQFNNANSTSVLHNISSRLNTMDTLSATLTQVYDETTANRFETQNISTVMGSRLRDLEFLVGRLVDNDNVVRNLPVPDLFDGQMLPCNSLCQLEKVCGHFRDFPVVSYALNINNFLKFLLHSTKFKPVQWTTLCTQFSGW